MKIENGVTNFAVYEDATEYYGMAEVTLPEITQISGDFNMSEKRSFFEQYSGLQTYNIFFSPPCSSLLGQLYII